jgi:hypothetical protein
MSARRSEKGAQHAAPLQLRPRSPQKATSCEWKEVFTLKQLTRVNLGLGLWLMISPFVLELVTRWAFRVGWEDLLLGFGIAIFSLCRLASPAGAEFWDFLIMGLGLTTLINPIVYHYFNVRVVAWNNLLVGSMVLILAIYVARKNSAAPQSVDGNRH